MFIDEIKELLPKIQHMEKSNNYYFHNHDCAENNSQTTKVTLEYKLANDKTDKIVKFGLCEHCKTLFYHEDFESTASFS